MAHFGFLQADLSMSTVQIRNLKTMWASEIRNIEKRMDFCALWVRMDFPPLPNDATAD